MKLFFELLRESVIIRGLLSIGSLAAIVLLLCLRIPVPGELWGLVGVAWGFFFGSGAHKDAAWVISHHRRTADGQS